MTPTSKSPSVPQLVNFILGLWLFISAFAWTHTHAQMTNTWIVGVLAVVFSAISMFVNSQARYLNTVLSIWLFISVWALPRATAGTAWNNCIVAILMFVASLTSLPSTRTIGRPQTA